MRRALNTFLQLIEQDQSMSVIVAATNFEELLDHAIFRRFDDLLHYTLPNATDVEPLVRRSIGTFRISGDWAKVRSAATGLSHADITTAARDTVKGAILSKAKSLTTLNLAKSLNNRRRAEVDPT